MNKTPRTDRNTVGYPQGEFVPVRIAKELETELSSANAQLLEVETNLTNLLNNGISEWIRSSLTADEKVEATWIIRAIKAEKEVLLLRAQLAEMRKAIQRVKHRTCTNVQPVGDSACDCCQHHWHFLAAMDQTEDLAWKGAATNKL